MIELSAISISFSNYETASGGSGGRAKRLHNNNNSERKTKNEI